MIYVVVGESLIVSMRQVRNEYISHAVLANGAPVRAVVYSPCATNKIAHLPETLHRQ